MSKPPENVAERFHVIIEVRAASWDDVAHLAHEATRLMKPPGMTWIEESGRLEGLGRYGARACVIPDMSELTIDQRAELAQLQTEAGERMRASQETRAPLRGSGVSRHDRRAYAARKRLADRAAVRAARKKWRGDD